jgi:16S rRNA (guanine527-N7)-methyltransferase
MDAQGGENDVSRETSERFEHFADLVRKWNPWINLVAKSTLDELHVRHIADSAQIYALSPKAEHWVDLGSGAGFPGLICAILADEQGVKTRFTLVESDRRKATFLRTAVRELGLTTTRIVADRVESVQPLGADVLSARALADLDALLAYAKPHLKPSGVALFPKGARWKDEVDAARQRWSFRLDHYSSRTHPEAVILKIGEVSHV